MSAEIERVLFLIASFLASLCLSLFFCLGLIQLQKRKKIEQPIHKLGVKSHFLKTGTPTMGGIGIIFSIFLIYILLDWKSLKNYRLLAMVIGILSFSIIGIIDDLLKVIKKNEKGLSAWLRIFLEIEVIIITFIIAGYDDSSTWYLNLYPFNNNLGNNIFFLLIAMFGVIASANSSNLLDGLDGLDGGVFILALLPVLVLAFQQGESDLGLLLLLIIGAVIGFLLLNSCPSKIFMGDSGSLFLGAVLAYSLIYLDKIILLPFIALIYIFETLSVIIQVFHYKRTRKRIFLMAPLHHHFELKGIPEYKIVFSYYFIQSVISLIVLIMEINL